MKRESRPGDSKESRGWWKPGEVNRMKFPLELQAEGFIVGCAVDPTLQGWAYVSTSVEWVF